MVWIFVSYKNYYRDIFFLMYICLVLGGKGFYILVYVLLLFMIYFIFEVFFILIKIC